MSVCVKTYPSSSSLLYTLQTNVKEQKKLADKERKLMEKAFREKEAALRDDNDVFDVSYENQTDNAADSAVSTKDIKVSLKFMP